MTLEEPPWRLQLRHALEQNLFPINPERQHLLGLVERYTCEYFDQLVQAVYRGDLNQAQAILVKHYPGSMARQEAIEQELRGPLDGA